MRKVERTIRGRHRLNKVERLALVTLDRTLVQVLHVRQLLDVDVRVCLKTPVKRNIGHNGSGSDLNDGSASDLGKTLGVVSETERDVRSLGQRQDTSRRDHVDLHAGSGRSRSASHGEVPGAVKRKGRGGR
mgnify:CR=1 FL=1